jgi:HK97 family phage major capsid protein
MNERLRALLKRKNEAVADADAILLKAESDNRDLTDEEVGTYEAAIERVKKLNAQVKSAELLETSTVDIDDDTTIEGGTPANAKTMGFESFGEFANAVAVAYVSRDQFDERLYAAAPTTAGNTQTGAEGGFTVPTDFRTAIMQAVGSEESLFSRTNQIVIGGNSMEMPVDETTDWQTSGGITVAWENELSLLKQSGIDLKNARWDARKVTALVPVSSDLLEDSTAMDSYIRARAPAKIGFAVDLAVMQGSGVDRPLGILNAPATLVVAKESGQGADTILRQNIDNIWMRMPAANRRNAVWVINQDIEAQLQSLQFVGTNSPQPVYMPAGGLSGQPFDTLKGRPVMYHQAANTLGDKGDISLIDFNQYATVVKRGGIRADVSIHLFFDADATAFRFIMRVGGNPWLAAPIQPRAGGNTLSPFVTLAERA